MEDYSVRLQVRQWAVGEAINFARQISGVDAEGLVKIARRFERYAMPTEKKEPANG